MPRFRSYTSTRLPLCLLQLQQQAPHPATKQVTKHAENSADAVHQGRRCVYCDQRQPSSSNCAEPVCQPGTKHDSRHNTPTRLLPCLL